MSRQPKTLAVPPGDLINLRIDGLSTRRRVLKISGLWRRLNWLVRGRKLDDPCGLWVTPCQTVVATRQRIDVVFLHSDGTIARIDRRLAPWRHVVCREARSALKLRAGMVEHLGLRPGMALDLVS